MDAARQRCRRKNVWFYIDVAGDGDGVRRRHRIDLLVSRPTPRANPGGFPIGGQTRIDLPNDHLQYAITWFALAVTLTVIFLIYQLPPPRPPDEHERQCRSTAYATLEAALPPRRR